MAPNICDKCYFTHGERIPASKESPCSKCGNGSTDIPADYEPCERCGYDHAYEPQEAMREHARLARVYAEHMNEL
jgi:hypothetical protein